MPKFNLTRFVTNSMFRGFISMNASREGHFIQ
jgi:hypothetical protein